MTSRRILHVGCGRKGRLDAEELFASVHLSLPGTAAVTSLDADPKLQPDIVCTLGRDPIPLPNNSVDVAIAWHVLEHVGVQGESDEWFCAMEELYRVLTPNGLLYGESPSYDSIWAWSDPTHTRALSEHSFVFFMQDAYRIPNSPISPYRIHADFRWASMPGLPKGFTVIESPADPRDRSLRFALAARKPFVSWWNDASQVQH